MRVNRCGRLVSTLAIALLTSACQGTMSIEEAKKVTASFSGASFVPPPRTINDITAILDQQKLANPAAVTKARARADQAPPKTTDPNTLSDFYYQRGLAAREIGRTLQEIDDLARAAQLVVSPEILMELGRAEVTSGSFSSALKDFRQAIGAVPNSQRGWLIGLNALLAGFSALAGDFDAAEAAMQECLRVLAESNNWRDGVPPGARARWNGLAAWAQANILEAKGQFVRAEASWREAVEEYRKGNRPDLVEKEEREAKILEEYLPPQLSDAEIEAIVKEVIDETGAMGPRDIGKVMGLVMPRVKGRADGRKVSDIVGRLLTT